LPSLEKFSGHSLGSGSFGAAFFEAVGMQDFDTRFERRANLLWGRIVWDPQQD
jgi:hypothetical protein